MKIKEPYHEGELYAQERAGESEEGRRNGRVIADSIMQGALRFIAQQPMMIVASVDDKNNVWGSALFGPPGFAQAPSDRTVEIEIARTFLDETDPLWKNIESNSQVGALFLEQATRRRLRVNGVVQRTTDGMLRLSVAECYPNCPKYIQRRDVCVSTSQQQEGISVTADGRSLTDKQSQLIRSSDTFFVASAHPERGADASHRGGEPGFVQMLDNRTLRVPDYSGNSMFNTLGNFRVHPRAGLVFIDFEHNKVLQITGEVAVQWEREDSDDRSTGTGRWWDFTIDSWREVSIGSQLRWEFQDDSPHNPKLNDQ